MIFGSCWILDERKFYEKIAILSENPNDVQAIANLLKKKYNYKFISLLRTSDKITGDMLRNQKNKHTIRKAFQFSKPDLVLFSLDLDATQNSQNYKDKLAEKKATYSELKSLFYTSKSKKNSIFLLNIYELEALILADIETINQFYNSDFQIIKSVELIKAPKEFLKSKISYNEGKSPQVFALLDFETVQKNCAYFSDFVIRFDEQLS